MYKNVLKKIDFFNLILTIYYTIAVMTNMIILTIY